MTITNNKWIKYLVRLSESALSLLVVFLMLAATVVMTGRLLGHEFIEKESKMTVEVAPNDLCERMEHLKGCNLEPLDSVRWKVFTSKHKSKGILLNSYLIGRDIVGFSGPTPLYILLDNKGRIVELEAQENSESTEYFENAWALITSYWTGKNISEKNKIQIDALTGATYSVSALDNTIRATLAFHEGQQHSHFKAPVIGWYKTIALILVLLLGLGAAAFFRGNKTLRLIVLLLNVGVVGFWCGQFVSLTLLRNWIENGVDLMGALPAVLLVALAFLAPVFGMKKHYCHWACPLGSAQELAYRLPLPKLKVSARTYRILATIRLWALLLLLFLLWMGVGAEVLNYEPFGVFLLDEALWGVLVLASVFIIAGCFVPRPWCRTLCPVGELLRLTERS